MRFKCNSKQNESSLLFCMKLTHQNEDVDLPFATEDEVESMQTLAKQLEVLFV
jgi:hypothetical protein